MKLVIYLLALIIFFATNLSAQERDSLIQLYPGLGDTVDSFDARYFELFQNIVGFEQAVFYIRNDQRLISKVTFSEDDKTRDTTFIQPLSALDDVRKNIAEIEKENELKLEMDNEALVFLKDEDTISGRLIMFNKDWIFIVTENEDKNFASKYLKIHLENIYQIKILGPNRTLSYGGLGAVVGVLLLPVNALVGAWALVTMWVFNPITCGVIGLVVGAISSRYEDIYIIETNYDILELKDDVKYYFRYDESVEEQYVEIR
jgi:hypothetical protein